MSSIRTWIVGAAAVLAAGSWVGPAAVRAAEVLDQQNDVDMSATADTATPFAVETGQTFTVGVAGTLSRVELQINRLFGIGGTVILTIYNTTGGTPNASLGTASLNWDAIPSGGFAFQSFDLSGLSIPVALGDVMAYTIKSSGETGFGLRSTFNVNTYSGGESKWRSLGPPPGVWQTYSPSHDVGFKIYVIAAAAALPGDYNGDQIVNAADYTVWRNNLATDFDLHDNGNEAGDSVGVVDQADYETWKANFGEFLGGSGASAVPEPSMLALVAIAGLTLIGSRRR